MRAPLIQVGYTEDELDRLVSCANIIEGRVRGVLPRNGRLYAITGAGYDGDDRTFYVCEAIPAALYPRPTKSYVERSREFDQFDRTPDPDPAFRTVGSRLREEGRYYEGVRVICRNEAYVLGAERERWKSTARMTEQRSLL